MGKLALDFLFLKRLWGLFKVRMIFSLFFLLFKLLKVSFFSI